MTDINTIEALEALYGKPSQTSVLKVVHHLTPAYKRWIEASPLLALATGGPGGLDCSPRGDQGQAVFVASDTVLHMPDRRGNNRIDSLRNILHNPQVALLFFVPGSNMCVRVNGTARITSDPDLLERYRQEDKAPRSVVIITLQEVYFQCARALMRSGIWQGETAADAVDLPTPGDIMQEIESAFDGAAYDRDWPARAAKTMW